MKGIAAIAWQQRIWIGAAASAAFFWVFVIPWWFPPQLRVAGPSYDLGFNNRVAILGLMAAVCLGAALRIFSSLDADSLSWLNERIVLLPPLRSAAGGYAVTAFFALTMSMATLRLHAWLVNPYWGESGFYLSRIDLLDMGFTPYVDFHHNHGPLTLYVPLWVQRLSQGSLGLEDAYAWTVVAGYVLGFVAMFVFFQALPLRGIPKVVALTLTCLPWTCMTFGLNYVPLRFFVVPAALVVLDVVIKRPCSSSTLATVMNTLAAVAGCIASLGMSPEMGFASAAGIVAYAGVLWMRSQRRLAIILAASTLLTVLGLAFLVPGYVLGVQGFALGGNNFPIYPNLHNLVFISVCLVVMSPLIAAAWTRPRDARAPLAAALCAAGGLLIAPAFGRADPGHVIFNSIIPLTIMFAASFGANPRAGWSWTAAYGLVAVVMIHISYWNHYAWLYREAHANAAYVQANPHALVEWREQWDRARDHLQSDRVPAWSKTVPCPVELLPLLRGKSISLPVAPTQQISLERFVKLQKRFRPQYHPTPVPEMFSPTESERTAREALRNELVVLPGNAESVANSPIDLRLYGDSTCDWLSELLLFPVSGKVVTEPFFAEQDVFRRVLADSEVVSRLPSLLVVRPSRPVPE